MSARPTIATSVEMKKSERFIFSELGLDTLFISEESLHSDCFSNQANLGLVEHSVHRNVAINSVDFNKAVNRVDDSIQDGMFSIHFQ